ncbi:MAG: hypothetical protein RL272_724 [Candidatus Parcubacteria bacterium]|jgi:general stress protein 26
MLMKKATREERAEALRFLRENIYAAVATLSSEGRPQLAFMYYSVDADFCLYIMTKRDSRKCKSLLQNGVVAVAVGDEQGVESVQMEGTAKEITDGAELAHRAKEIFRSPRVAGAYLGKEKLKFLPSMSPVADPVANALFVIRPDWLRLLRINQKTGESEFLNILP